MIMLCGNMLDLLPLISHGSHLSCIKDLFYLGDTRSVEDFDIFHRMPSERGCGVRPNETFCPLPPQDRSGLYTMRR